MQRRTFFTAAAACGMAAAGAAGAPAGAKLPRHVYSPSQRRWRVAFGLNGFMSSEAQWKQRFPIWEVLEFAQREGFDGIELADGWPQGPYPGHDQDAKIASLRDLCARYNLKIFSIQTPADAAFHPDPAVRAGYVTRFRGWAALARKLGGECIGIWPGGPLNGQSVEAAAANLIGSLKEAAAIARDNGLLASVELEPPFPFNTIDMLIKIVDGVDHPCLRGMYDPSHFDLMTGGKGTPEEGLRRVGVERIGYLHLTDSDGTIFAGTSRHLPCGEGHIDMAKSLEFLWEGGYTGWIMIDAWMTEDPYRACRKGREAVMKVLDDAGREPAK